MVRVSGSTSARTGWALTCSITFIDETNVIGVEITWSPGPIPRAAKAICSAPVHELTATAAAAPIYEQNSFSNNFVLGPVVIQFERNVSTTASISSSDIAGGENERKFGLAVLVINPP